MIRPRVTQRPRPNVTLYTMRWCGDCRRMKSRLEERRVPYEEIEVGLEAVDVVLQHNGGKCRLPTFLLDGVFHPHNL